MKFYSGRMLSTVDLHSLFKTLLQAYGGDMPIEFVAMNEAERMTCKSTTLPLILDRFHVFEIDEASGTNRRPDLEREAIEWGIK
ncbi:hypothetical protein [Singulisphaera sp. PoT]|uniref:hypothetical protein n=1 Tax=Singulisphaera sp. PoT TaxID=3411797 RepID=UPI003BF55796